jgi:Cu2+-exporting ATPase
MKNKISCCIHCQNFLAENQKKFCCNGCEIAFSIINEAGFESYYKIRQIDPKEKKNKPDSFDKIDISEFVKCEKDSYSISLMIQGLHCAACVWLIESILNKQPDVEIARINFSKKNLFLKWRRDLQYGNRLVEIINQIGYKLIPFDEEILLAEEKKYDNSILRCLAIAGFGAGNVMLFSFSLWFTDPENMGSYTRNLFHFFSSLLALPVIILSSRPFFSSAYKSIKAGYPNMDLAISIAIFLACVVSLLETFRGAFHVYFDSAVMLVFFLLIGRYLDMKARKKAFTISSEFMLLASGFARVEDGLQIKTIPIKNLQEGMIINVAAGEKISGDGVIISGKSEINNFLISGESLPKEVSCGDYCYGGSINLISPIRIKINRPTEKSLLAQIINFVSDIENKKSFYLRLADRLAKIYLPAVHLIALITFCLWFFYFKSNWEIALINATAVLIITCPCALALAVPIVQTIFISQSLKKGVLFKSGQAIEKINEIDLIVFDKTGSITEGELKLSDVVLLENNQQKSIDLIERNSLLKIAASLCKNSKHPISVAIFNAYSGNLENIETIEERGFGLVGKFNDLEVRIGKKEFCKIEFDNSFDHNSLVCFFKFNQKNFAFFFRDQIKQDAKLTIDKLKKLGKEIILLSGDRQEVVDSVAKELNIVQFYANQTPFDKIEFLKKLKIKNQKFMMVGDGINDAPSLAFADVSISFSKASDLAQNVADILIQGQKLMPILTTIYYAKRAINLMKQNLLISLLYNIIALPFAIFGNVVPLFAAIAMSSSSLLVLFNSLRMNKNVSINFSSANCN